MTTPDKILTQKHVRVFTQDGGARPNVPTRLSGVDNQFLSVGGLAVPVRGSVDRIRVHDPMRIGGYITVGSSETPADFPTFSLMVRERHGAIPKALTGDLCPFNVYVNSGKCTDIADFLRGWSDYVLILSQCEVTNVDGGDRTSWDGDDPLEDSMDVTATGGAYPVGALSFADTGTTEVAVEVLDVTYASRESCGNCGPANDGSKWMYALTTTGVDPAAVVYSTDGGATWTALAITGMGALEVPTAIRVINGYLVVFSKLGGGATLSSYYISPMNTKTGVPSSTWAEITTGFVATFPINDVYVANSREVYLVADGGYIYTTDNIATGVTVLNAAAATTANLLRVAGDGQGTIIAVSNTGKVVKSVNRGVTWALTAADPSGASLISSAVLDQDRYWVGTTTGLLYYTLDGGESWAGLAYPGSGANRIEDIVFATDEVGYLLTIDGDGVGVILSTWNGGEQWTRDANRILNTVSAVQKTSRLAYPQVSNLTVRANNVLVAALGAATDGAILVGAPNLL